MTTDTDSYIQPSYSVQHVRDVRIPMSDGTRLIADLYLPEGVSGVPAVLEYQPYRKDDLTSGEAGVHYYFAERGFGSAHVDVRGTGGSEGVATDEYSPQEQKDALEIIDWLSRQPWCNGNVGMWGTSYGGFNTIQTAMHAPPALKAIVPHAATDDRYQDDVHYFGGCMMAIDQVLYPLSQISMNALPPYREHVPEDWASIWKQHLEGNPPWILEWLRHQTEDAYWLQGSLKTDYKSIKCPVYHIGAWSDGYTNPVFRMLEHLQVPNKALVGPWTHLRPHEAFPGPRINYLHEMVRWWAQWLKGEETGIMQEPRIALYIQEGAPPDPFLPYMPGGWRYLESWPPDGVEQRKFYLSNQGRLRGQPDLETEGNVYRYRATVGTAAGFWCPISSPLGLARDQATDEARSLVYTTEILESPLEILGSPEAVLFVSSTAEIVTFVAKISDIAPNGSSTLVSRGVLNATHRISHRDPSPLKPGEVYELRIPLKVVSWIFQPGHRLRVAISSSDWPTIWPSPQPASNTVFCGSARPTHIILPIASGLESPISSSYFLSPPELRSGRRSQGDEPDWSINQDIIRGLTTVNLRYHRKFRPEGKNFDFEEELQSEVGASDEDPAQAYAKGVQRYSIFMAEGRIDVVGRLAIRSTSKHLHPEVQLSVTVDNEPLFNRQWMETIPRNLF